MNSQAIFGLQFTLSLVTWAVIVVETLVGAHPKSRYEEAIGQVAA